MKIDTSSWDYRNMWVTQSGELCTRPGADVLWLFISSGISAGPSKPYGGFSIKLQFVDSIFHYVLLLNQDNSPATLEMNVIDENLSSVKRVQSIPLGIDRPIRAISHAVVNGELIVSGPEIPTLWGYTGSGLVIAEEQESVDVSVETLSMPNGICTSWAGRCVIAKGEAVFISDPLAPRTYTAGGIVTLPGTIYGLHVTANGSLVMATADGVYGLSSQAAAQGRKIIGSIQKLSSYQATNYGQTAMTPFGLYGLTRRGVKQIDVASSKEISLSDKTYVRSLSDMISFPDYREGKLFQTNEGLAVFMGTIDQDGDEEFGGGICRLDMESNIKTWWTQSGLKRLVGVLKEREGDDLFLMEHDHPGGSASYIFKYHLDSDFGTDAEYFGGISGLVRSDADLSPVVRAVYTEADNGGALVRVAVRGEYRKNNGTDQEVTTTANGVIINQDLWRADATPGAKKLKTTELESYRFQFAKRTNDISIETSAQGGKTRIGTVNLATGGYAQRRPK